MIATNSLKRLPFYSSSTGRESMVTCNYLDFQDYFRQQQNCFKKTVSLNLRVLRARDLHIPPLVVVVVIAVVGVTFVAIIVVIGPDGVPRLYARPLLLDCMPSTCFLLVCLAMLPHTRTQMVPLYVPDWPTLFVLVP